MVDTDIGLQVDRHATDHNCITGIQAYILMCRNAFAVDGSTVEAMIFDESTALFVLFQGRMETTHGLTSHLDFVAEIASNA